MLDSINELNYVEGCTHSSKPLISTEFDLLRSYSSASPDAGEIFDMNEICRTNRLLEVGQRECHPAQRPFDGKSGRSKVLIDLDNAFMKDQADRNNSDRKTSDRNNSERTHSKNKDTKKSKSSPRLSSQTSQEKSSGTDRGITRNNRPKSYKMAIDLRQQEHVQVDL